MQARRKTFLAIGDFAMMHIALAVAVLVRLDGSGSLLSHVQAFTPLFVIWCLVLFVFNLYELEFTKPTPQTVGRFALVMAINTLIGVGYFYTFKSFGITPRLTLVITAAVAFVGIIGWRRLFMHAIETMLHQTWCIVGDTAETRLLGTTLKSKPFLGSALHIPSFEREIPHTDILVIPETTPVHQLVRLRARDVRLFTYIQALEYALMRTPIIAMQERHVISIMQQQRPWWTPLARMTEILFACIGLVLATPFLVVAIMAIVLTDGKTPFYTQLRTGVHEKLFRIYKLRTMRVNAEKNGAQWASQDDARITSVGRILRKLHIDELPQMINIIKGDLALVGPRPERPEFVRELEREIPYYWLRHTIKPGFTGWAQIKYRYAATVDDSREKFEYDLYYLRNRNLLLDIGIVMKTIQIIVTHR